MPFLLVKDLRSSEEDVEGREISLGREEVGLVDLVVVVEVMVVGRTEATASAAFLRGLTMLTRVLWSSSCLSTKVGKGLEIQPVSSIGCD